MTAPFDPIGALSALTQARVRFVLIGGLAARMLGSPTVTGDIDICHALDEDNLVRLAAFLGSADARLRGAEDVAVTLDAALLARTHNVTLSTTFGAIDCLGEPAGKRSYDELIRTAEKVDLGEFSVMRCSLEDLIHMKSAAGRRKDLIELEILGALEQESRPDQPPPSQS